MNKNNLLDRFVMWLAKKNGTSSNSQYWERDIKALIISGMVALVLLLVLKFSM